MQDNSVVLHFFHEDGDVGLGTAEAIKRADDDALYFPFPVAFAHKG